MKREKTNALKKIRFKIQDSLDEEIWTFICFGSGIKIRNPDGKSRFITHQELFKDEAESSNTKSTFHVKPYYIRKYIEKYKDGW